MRRLMVLMLVFVLLACQAVTALPGLRSTPTPQPGLKSHDAPPRKAATPTPTIASSPQGDFSVRYHPDGGLYSGDWVSFEIIAPPGRINRERSATVQVDSVEGALFGPAEFGRFGIAGRQQATLTWAWDTSDLAPGNYDLTFSIQPDGIQWTQTVTLLPESDLPDGQAGARWAQAESDCCLLYYITGTEAERDIAQLEAMADDEAERVERAFQAELTKPVELVLLPRVLGHGGFTESEISISYLDRRYSGGDPAIVLRHEMVHYLDNSLGGELRPTLLLEGLAVYLSGGHFKEEALLPRAAALLELGWYQPLTELANDFYPSQHETGYLEAGALVEYMIERWGWEAFERFYRDIHPGPRGNNQADAIDAALREHFEISFAELEADFRQRLQEQDYTPAQREDVRLTVEFYDTVRRYQQALDPSAYYLTAWLPDGEKMRERGIVADYLRHPSAPENVTLETLLVSADEHLRSGEYAEAEKLLEAMNGALDALGK